MAGSSIVVTTFWKDFCVQQSALLPPHSEVPNPMAAVTGRTLRQLLDEHKRLPLAQALPIFDEILQAMTLAGQDAVLRHHLQPPAIVIGHDRRVTVMGYGSDGVLAHGSPAVDLNPATSAYLSPELISGQAVDLRSHIFSLGAVLYETLTGEPPFPAEGAAALRRQILEVEPVPPRVLNINIPDSLDNLVRKALAKNPAERYQNPTEMLTALRTVSHALQGTPEDSRRSPPANVTERSEADYSADFKDREPACLPRPSPPMATVAGIQSTVTARTATSPWTEPASGRAWSTGKTLSCLAVLLGLLVGAGLAGWQMLAVPVEQATSQSDDPPATLVENGRGGAAESELASAVAALIDQAKSLWESDPETAQKLLEQAAALDPNHFEAAFQLARFLTFRKEFPAAIQQYRTALRMNDQAPDIYFNLGYIFLSQGDLDQAIENYQTCLALSPPYRDEVLTNLAVCHWQKNNPPQARLLLEQALALNPNNELAQSYRKILNSAVGPEK